MTTLAILAVLGMVGPVMAVWVAALAADVDD